MINLVVLLYRDSYFYSKYGPSVRDLQFLFELEKLSKIKKNNSVQSTSINS